MKNFKIITFLSLVSFSFLAFQGCYQTATASTEKISSDISSALQWYSVSDLDELQKKAPKKVIVDIYTDWCKWCKVMDEKTFTDAELISYLNSNYYMVKLNAETKSDISFKGTAYGYVQSGRRGYHSLAKELSKDKLSYPSFAILDKNLNVVDVTRGFKAADQFKTYLEALKAL